MIWTIILFFVLLSVLVLVHEWGHFIVAKKAGMEVEEFGLGFPPRIWAWKDKKGVEWSINLIPIGGFVKILGQNGEERTNKKSFAAKSIPWRFAVLFAGVFMNFLLAAVLFGILAGWGAPTIVEGELPGNVTVSDVSAQVVEVISGSPADSAGLQMGDKVISIDGTVAENGAGARDLIAQESQDGSVIFEIEREGDVQNIEIQTEYIKEIGAIGVGVGVYDIGTVSYPWYLAPFIGAWQVVQMTILIILALWGIIVEFFSTLGVSSAIAGPVGIAQQTGIMAQLGLRYMIYFAAVLSVNLAILNILPFPALDGGRIIFLAVEWIKGKPVDKKVEAIVHNTGFLLLMLIIILITFRDILNLF